jgi:putative peptidoglycan lipid II flippase
VGVPLAILVNPIANSLLPEIARLRSLGQLRAAFQLIDRTTAMAALAATGGCAFALLFRRPAIELFFQHGNFTAESTEMVSAVFLGMGPSLVGWSLIEISSRCLFALNRPWPPVIAVVVALFLNVVFTSRLHSPQPSMVGVGASLGLLVGFLVLFAISQVKRRSWLNRE